MSIKIKQTIQKLNNELDVVEQQLGPNGVVPSTGISALMQALSDTVYVRPVATACGSAGSQRVVTVADLRRQLKFVQIGASNADHNRNGKLEARELNALNALELRLLNMAAGTQMTPTPVATGCGSRPYPPVTPRVTTGCGT